MRTSSQSIIRRPFGRCGSPLARDETVSIVERIEEEPGKPVVTTNQAGI
jgi:hypothetical protein